MEREKKALHTKKIALLGSTGSIGTQTLQIAKHLRDEVKVVAIAAHSNVEQLHRQYLEFRPRLVACYDKSAARNLQKMLPRDVVVAGMEGVLEVATFADANLVVSAIAGTLGLLPTYKALQVGKDVALANKEALITGGSLITSCARRSRATLIPVDSEHSALFQCLQGEDSKTAQRLLLTASGGPFRKYTEKQLETVTVEQALAHPNWSMGPQVTINSSTLMNKGLELIEAYWLFGLPLSSIEVLIHPQSVVHSMVEFVDGSTIAQLGEPSMLTPIQYALTFPNRRPGLLSPFDFTSQPLEFTKPDELRFPALSIAREALRQGGTTPCFMNGANEALVHRFLRKEIAWREITTKLQSILDRHQSQPVESIEQLIGLDRLSKAVANNC